MSIERRLECKHPKMFTPDEIEGIKIISGIIFLLLFLVWFGTTVQGTRLIGF